MEKISLEQQKKWHDLNKELIVRSWESESFKQQLIQNPEAAIAEVAGKEIPKANFSFVVEDQTDTSKIFINIPKKVDMENFELTDAELDLVSGGTPLSDLGESNGAWVREKLGEAYDWVASFF